MGTLFNEQDRAKVLSRIERLAPDTSPAWGKFTAPEMVCHVGCALRQGLGEYDAGPPTGPLQYAPLNWLMIHVLPWPKGKAKSPPEFLSVRPTSWDADLADLHSLVVNFGQRRAEGDWPPNKIFGRISGSSWGALQYRHLDHHLTQFRV
jgi:hypothetical protein